MNWYKLNTDGSSIGNPSKSGGGGIIRNHLGDWIGGFARSIGTTSSIIAELWALRDSLNLCIQLQISHLHIEIDASFVVDMLNCDNRSSKYLSPLIDDCRVLLGKIPHHKIQHCFREANRCADNLAKKGADMEQDFISFVNPPDCIIEQVRLDALGTVYCRHCRGNAITL